MNETHQGCCVLTKILKFCFLLSLLTFIPGHALAQEEFWVIPRGREATVQSFVSPISDHGFLSYKTRNISIDRNKIKVYFDDSSTPVQSDECQGIDTKHGQSFIIIEQHIKLSLKKSGKGGFRTGSVSDDRLQLSWTLCGSSLPENQTERNIRSEAGRILETLSQSDLDAVWIRPLPSEATPDPPLYPWIIFTVFLALSILLAKKTILSNISLLVGFGALIFVLKYYWHHSEIALLWVILFPIILFLLISIGRDNRSDLYNLAILFLLSFISLMNFQETTSNWYVDYHPALDAQSIPVTNNPGGMAFWPQFISEYFPLSVDQLFLLSQISFSLSLSFLVVTMRKMCSSKESPWPQYTYFFWAVFLILDGTLHRLSASDAPHNISLLSWSIGLYICHRLVQNKPQNRILFLALFIALTMCTYLVGLTRIEQFLFPLSYLFIFLIDFRRNQRRNYLNMCIAIMLGMVVALSIVLGRSPEQHLQEPSIFSSKNIQNAFIALVTAGFDLDPVFPFYFGIFLILFFIVFCIMKPRFVLLFFPLVGFEILKFVSGFASGHIGGINPAQRYHIIVIPILLLIFSIALGFLVESTKTWLLSRGFYSTAYRDRILMFSLVFLMLSLLLLSNLAPLKKTPMVFQAEYQFLSNNLDNVPQNSVVAALWFNGLELEFHGVEGALGIPHATMVIDRPDLRWLVLRPNDEVPAEAQFLYLGATCSLRNERSVIQSKGGQRFYEYLRDYKNLCQRMEGRVVEWIDVEENTVRPMDPRIMGHQITLKFGRLRTETKGRQ